MEIRAYYDEAERHSLSYYQKTSWINRLFLHAPLERHVSRFIRWYGRQAAVVADIGCGHGDLLLKAVHRDTKLVLINDLSDMMIETSARKLAQNWPDLRVLREGGSPPSTESKFELVLCIGVLNHIRGNDLPDFLVKVADLSSGRIILFYAHKGFILQRVTGISFRKCGVHYRSHSCRSIRRVMEKAGFQAERRSYTFWLGLFSPMVVEVWRR